MRRKDFLAMNAALLGGLALPLKGRPAASLREIEAAAGSGDEDALWAVLRGQFLLDPDWTYLNFGGLGACPLPVLNSLAEWSRVEERAPSAGHDAKRWNEVKAKLATLLGRSCRMEDLALIGGATEGVNMILNGLPLKKGDEVITSTHEHVAVHTALLNRMHKDGIVIRLFEPDIFSGRGNVDRIARLVNGRTRLIFISHVTCTTGQRFPEREISELARSRGIWFALDGAQAPVNVLFDIVDCGVDFYTCSAHKWMMGPKRTGFLYVRQGMLEALRPHATGGGSAERYDIETNEIVFYPTAQRYEYGTQNDALFYALGTAVDFVNAVGVERIWNRGRAMAERFYRGLRQIPDVDSVSPREEAWRSCMIGFRMKTHDFGAVNAHLAKDKIRVRPVSEGKLNAIRVSFFLNNRMEDVDKILDSLKKLAG
ncbi:MAG: aminotransferase class V-fold PLP-dependent enzyme [Candidatus Aminicenantes bacterium]|nr:aminotransferase class V-fold PLP-dependent enzyme [Candidatus Aminicenantes bacterium]